MAWNAILLKTAKLRLNNWPNVFAAKVGSL